MNETIRLKIITVKYVKLLEIGVFHSIQKVFLITFYVNIILVFPKVLKIIFTLNIIKVILV